VAHATSSDVLAQAQQSSGAMVAYTTEAVATVESIDQQSRKVVLRGPGGNIFEVQAGPAVENLSRVKQGDRVVVHYVEALAASLARPGQSGGGTATSQAGITRYAPGQSAPTGTVGDQIRSTVTVDAIDKATHAVTFTGAGNRTQTVRVHDPEMQRFVDTLKVGDRIDLVYTQSLAVAVEPISQ
jgi:Cu/Ag efflux protein CusF